MRDIALAIVVLFFPTALCQPIVRNLGTPITSMSIRSSLLVIDPVTGRPTYYSGMYSSSGVGRLIRFDYADDRVEYFELPGTRGCYGLTEGKDGRIYVGTIYSARIFSFDPWTRTITDHGTAGGEEYVFELCTGADGRIYGGTYPNAKVVMYDPELDRVIDLGSFHRTEKYVGDLCVADNGRVFAGISPRADMVVYDPVTKEKRSILPPEYRDASSVDPNAEGNLVYASVDGRKLLIIDADTLEIIYEVDPPPGATVNTHVPISGGPLVIHGLPGGYVRFNRTTMELVPFYTPPISTYDNATGIAYTRTGGRQIFQAYNLTSGELLSEVDVSKDGDGMGIFSLGTGPDGCIYGGSVSILRLFKYDPATEVLEDLGFTYPWGGGGEFYSIHTHSDRLYMASYGGSVLGYYEPSQEWNPGTVPGSNPRSIGEVGGEQNRPHAMTSSADGKIFVGSEPDYGKHGGALSIYDPATDSFEVHRHIVPNQTVLSLTASVDGWTIYGGTSTRGGTGTDPITTKAHFFAWDVRTGQKTLDIIPVIGANDIHALATAPDGRIYGSAGTGIFVYDPVVGGIIQSQGGPGGAVTVMVTCWDGLIYGRTERTIFRMKPISQPGERVRFEILHTCQERSRGLALDGDGRAYFGDGPDLYLIENIPRPEIPTQNAIIYAGGLSQGWSTAFSGAEVVLDAEYPGGGRCQEITLDRFCTLEYFPQEPWDITLWEYRGLSFSIDPGNATISKLMATKTGPGSSETVSVLEAYAISLRPGHLTHVRVPVQDLDWAFGSRLESLKFIVLGSGTFYISSIYLEAWEPAGCLGVMLVAFGVLIGWSRSVG